MHDSAVTPDGIPAAEDEDDFAAYTVPEAATRLRLSQRKVWLMVKSGELRSFKVGKSRRIPVEEIPAYIERRIKAA
jgi:excisionase family DNA binding protein